MSGKRSRILESVYEAVLGLWAAGLPVDADLLADARKWARANLEPWPQVKAELGIE